MKTPKELIEFVRAEYWLNEKHAHGGLETLHAVEYIDCVEWMRKVNETTPLTNFIEIGSAYGGSFHLWSTIIRGTKISIDICGPWPCITEDHMRARNKIWDSHFPCVYSVNADSHKKKTVGRTDKILQGELIDWLYIDATHTYEAAKTEFEMYKKFVRPGGYVGFHDIRVNELPSLNRYWEEISAEYPSWEFGNSDGKYTNIPLIGVIQI